MSISEKEAQKTVITPLDRLKQASLLMHDYLESMTALSRKMDSIINDMEEWHNNLIKEKYL